MFVRDLQTYLDAVLDEVEIGIIVYSIETGEVIVLSYAVVADINEYGELMLGIEI